ncbi:MAG: hypothetical protein U0324_04750 [Polyangiales bacterium]
MRRFAPVALLTALAPASALAQQAPAATPAPAAAPAPAATPAPAPAAARRPTPWAASQLSITSSANWDLFDYSYRPSSRSLSVIDLNVSLRPRYRINRALQLRARWDYNFEFTNSDTTQTQYEPRFGDPSLDLWFLGLPSLGDFRFALAGGFIFPVSPESRAQTLILTPRVIGQVAWGIEALGGEIAVIGQVIYSHRFLQYTTPGIRGDFPYQRTVNADFTGSPGIANQLSGLPGVHDQLSWTVILAPSWGKWSPGVAFSMTHQWSYDISRGGSTTATTSANQLPTGDHLRQLSSFSGWLDYNPTAWLTIEAGYFMTRRLLRDDGTWGNPIYDPYQDWRVYLNANIVLDKFFEAITGGGQGEGGVIRTQNTPRRDVTARF